MGDQFLQVAAEDSVRISGGIVRLADEGRAREGRA